MACLGSNRRRLYPSGGQLHKGSTGEVVCVRRPPDLAALRTELAAVLAAGITSCAVVLKHAAIFPDHEVAVGELAASMGFQQVRGRGGCGCGRGGVAGSLQGLPAGAGPCLVCVPWWDLGHVRPPWLQPRCSPRLLFVCAWRG